MRLAIGRIILPLGKEKNNQIYFYFFKKYYQWYVEICIVKRIPRKSA